MPWKLWGLFCQPAVAHTGYFDCVMNATAWKVKFANMFVMLIIWCKIQQKSYYKLQFIEKMNPIKGKKCMDKLSKSMDKFFDPYLDILMNWASRVERPQKSLPKLYLWFQDIGKENLYFTRP